jgi:hypothetical protein
MDEALKDALREGNLGEVERLVEWDPRLLDARDDGSFPPLVFASAQGHTEVVRWLLDKGAAVNELYSLGGSSALCHACHEGRVPVVRLLLAEGADPAIATKKGTTQYRAPRGQNFRLCANAQTCSMKSLRHPYSRAGRRNCVTSRERDRSAQGSSDGRQCVSSWRATSLNDDKRCERVSQPVNCPTLQNQNQACLWRLSGKACAVTVLSDYRWLCCQSPTHDITLAGSHVGCHDDL